MISLRNFALMSVLALVGGMMPYISYAQMTSTSGGGVVGGTEAGVVGGTEAGVVGGTEAGVVGGDQMFAERVLTLDQEALAQYCGESDDYCDLSQLGIAEITEDAFDNHEYLEFVDLSFNYLRDLPESLLDTDFELELSANCLGDEYRDLVSADLERNQLACLEVVYDPNQESYVSGGVQATIAFVGPSDLVQALNELYPELDNHYFTYNARRNLYADTLTQDIIVRVPGELIGQEEAQVAQLSYNQEAYMRSYQARVVETKSLVIPMDPDPGDRGYEKPQQPGGMVGTSDVVGIITLPGEIREPFDSAQQRDIVQTWVTTHPNPSTGGGTYHPGDYNEKDLIDLSLETLELMDDYKVNHPSGLVNIWEYINEDLTGLKTADEMKLLAEVTWIGSEEPIDETHLPRSQPATSVVVPSNPKKTSPSRSGGGYTLDRAQVTPAKALEATSKELISSKLTRVDARIINPRLVSQETKLIDKPVIVESPQVDSKFNEAHQMLYSYGLTKWRGSEEFKPRNAITREQAAKFMVEFAEKILQRSPVLTYNARFTDLGSADPSLRDAIKKSYEYGIFNGDNKHTDNSIKTRFRPQEYVSAKELAAIMYRLVTNTKLDEPSADRSLNYKKELQKYISLPQQSQYDRETVAKLIYNLYQNDNYLQGDMGYYLP